MLPFAMPPPDIHLDSDIFCLMLTRNAAIVKAIVTQMDTNALCIVHFLYMAFPAAIQAPNTWRTCVYYVHPIKKSYKYLIFLACYQAVFPFGLCVCVLFTLCFIFRFDFFVPSFVSLFGVGHHYYLCHFMVLF